MQNDYKYVAQVASTMAMEGMKLSESELKRVQDCASGRQSTSNAINGEIGEAICAIMNMNMIQHIATPNLKYLKIS